MQYPLKCENIFDSPQNIYYGIPDMVYCKFIPFF
jgi:hypothetical protein